MKSTVTEKFRLRKSLLGWFTNPCDSEHHPLLSQLQGDLPRAQWARIEQKDVKLAIAEIKEVAHGMGMTVQVCGNLKNSPTVILRRHALPEEWTEPTSLPPAENWRIRIASVHGTDGYQVTHVRPSGAPDWILSCQAPAALIEAIELDLDRLALGTCSRADIWDIFSGKSSALKLPCGQAYIVEFTNDMLALEVDLATAIPVVKTFSWHIGVVVDLKWCVFSEHAESWVDYGYGHVVEMLAGLVKGRPWPSTRPQARSAVADGFGSCALARRPGRSRVP